MEIVREASCKQPVCVQGPNSRAFEHHSGAMGNRAGTGVNAVRQARRGDPCTFRVEFCTWVSPSLYPNPGPV